MVPELSSHPLARADGSATVSNHLFTVIAAVNGPIEVQRRDELPEEAAIEVNFRPSSGVGGPRERWFEMVLSSLLRSLLLVHIHPRTLIQVTLQVTKEPSVRIKRGVLDIALIPTLANAAFLALVDGSLPLAKTMTAVLGCVGQDGKVANHPTDKQLIECSSVHAMVYTMQGDLLLDESSGSFNMTQWDQIAEELKRSAVAAMASVDEDESMSNGDGEGAP